MPKSTKQTEVTFLSISEFKEKIGCDILDIVQNPNTDKLFVSANGKNFKCQQDINPELPMSFLVPDDNIDESCLCNVKASDSVQFSL